MAETISFYTLSILILGLAILVVTARNTVHSVLFLVMNFLCVAVIYVVLEAEFLAVIQILVYAGGIVVLYLFVVMLVNLGREPEAHQDPRRHSMLGLGLAGAVLVELVGIVVYGYAREPSAPVTAAAVKPAWSTAKSVGSTLMTDSVKVTVKSTLSEFVNSLLARTIVTVGVV